MGQDDRPSVLAILAPDQENPASEQPQICLYEARTPREVAGHLPDVTAVVLWEFEGSLLRGAWSDGLSLDWIHVAGAGVDDILFPELIESSVTVTNSRGVFDEPVAEYTVALLAALAKQVPETLSLQADHRWKHRQTTRLSGGHVVVVGPGSIGRAIARKLKPLGMHVVGIGRTSRQGDEDFESIQSTSSLVEQVVSADHVVVAAPLTVETRNLFDASVFQEFRGATLINVGRGEIVDTDALIEGLDSGRVGAAALDVFDYEPLPFQSPLWSHPRVIVSPHMAGDVPGIGDDLVCVWRRNLERWLDGKPLANVVRKDLGFV